jgi:hypothetical protein
MLRSEIPEFANYVHVSRFVKDKLEMQVQLLTHESLDGVVPTQIGVVREPEQRD